MVKKKVLITGGSGYLGARLSLHLANEGYAVTALCHSKTPLDQSWVSKIDKVVVGDVKDEKFLIDLAKYKYDILVHLVSLDHHKSNGLPSKVSSVNITPVWTLLDIFSKQGLGKFIYLSTAQVYGNLQVDEITENRKLNPQNAYGLTHQVSELFCEFYNSTTTVECRSIRLSNSYGAPILQENNCWWLVINDLCRMAYTQKKIILQSDGSPLRDFIHGWDVCSGIQTILETSELHTTYNLSSGKTYSIMDIAHEIKKVYKKRYDYELSITAQKQSNNIQMHKYRIDNSLIRSIGFETKWNLKTGINDFFHFLENNNI
jgi:UDP-glucose 4-epimerase